LRRRAFSGKRLQVVALPVLRPAWKDLQLTPQRQQVRHLLQEHHDRIRTLLDKNPKASRQELTRKFTPSAAIRTTRFTLC
jgi:hypothetical protein